MFKKFGAITLVLVLAFLLVLSGCQSKSISFDSVVFKINDEEILYDEFSFRLNSVKNEIQSGSPLGADVWQTEINGKPALQHAKEVAVDLIKTSRAEYLLATQYGIVLSEGEMAAYESSKQQAITSMYGSEAKFLSMLKDELKTTERAYRSMYLADLLRGKLYDALYSPEDTEMFTDNQVIEFINLQMLRTHHIQVVLAGLSDADKQTARTSMEEFYTRLEAGETFTDLMAEYNQGVPADEMGNLFLKEEPLPPYAQATEQLSPGKYSQILEIDDTLVIIKRLPIEPDIFESDPDNFREMYRYYLFEQQLKQISDGFSVELTSVYEEVE